MTDDFLRSVAVSGSSVPVSRSIIIVIVRVIVNDDLFTSGLLKFTSQLLLSGATLFCFVFFLLVLLYFIQFRLHLSLGLRTFD